MYEAQTYEVILRRMLDRAETWAHEQGFVVDTRELSLIRFGCVSAAAELAQAYIELDQVLDESSMDTQSRSFLIRRVKEFGVVPYPSTFAIRNGEFNMDVSIGSRFSLNKLNYVIIEKINDFNFQMQCETPGVAGNFESGTLIPIDYIQGLTLARLTGVLIPGEDEETTEHLRQRFNDSLESQAFGGNIADYVEKIGKLPGVTGGGVKIYPAWQGGGTVKAVILDSQKQKPSNILIDEVQTIIDPILNQGLGYGLAPIGHVVTVTGVEETTVDIATSLSFQSGAIWGDVEPLAKEAIDTYFMELAGDWDKVDWRKDPTATLTVRIVQIEQRLFDIPGVIDVENTTINGGHQNLTLGVDNIPKRGDLLNV